MLEPPEAAQEVELFVTVLNRHSTTGNSVKTFMPTNPYSEQDFQAIGIACFFATDQYHNVDREDVLVVKPA